MKRFGVERCDEGGTLFDSFTGEAIDHTWSVVDRSQRDDYGHYHEVSNHRTRKLARDEADQLNAEDFARRAGIVVTLAPGHIEVKS